jgi:hypothetical protein
MGPLFGFPIEDSENPPPSRKRATVGIIIGGMVAMVLGLLLVLAPRMMMSTSVWGVIGVFVVIMILIIAGLVVTTSQRQADRAKRKRGPNGQDMYTLIDRMMDNLDDDELDYLRDRLTQREHGPKHELAESLGDLLDQREEYRETGRH